MQGIGEINIDGRYIGEGHPPFIIAEISANHNGSLDAALALIEEAKRCGADAVKIGAYTANTITLKSDLPEFQITEGLWAGRIFTIYMMRLIRLGNGTGRCLIKPVLLE